MQIRSNSFQHRQRLDAEFAAGRATADGFGFAANRNPHLAWDKVPDGTRSFVLICIDPDVPTVAEMVGRDDVQIPEHQVRGDFIHWVVADLPADLREIAAGSCSDGVVAHGKRDPAGPRGARQGLNDYTGWFASDPDLAGDWYGYDGAFPPPNDLRLHRYFFRIFALDVERLPLDARFTAADALNAMQGHVLGQASIYATYSLNPQVKG